MNFSPFYYQVQEIISNDDDKALRNIFNNLDTREEFNSYYEDFLHCTYPKSFKCLYFLMNDMNKRYNIHSVFTHCFKKNNAKWLTLFFDIFNKKIKENKENKNSTFILSNNILVMSMDFDYSSFLESNKQIWNIIFSHESIGFFKPHMLVNEIFDSQQFEKIYLVEELCHKYAIALPIKNIIQKGFQENELDMVEYFLEKYQPQFDDNDLTDILNFVSLTGNVNSFKFFTQHFLSFENFNFEKIALSFNAGFLVNKTEIAQYLKEHHNIDFYPIDERLRNEFLHHRNTMWEDNDENSPSTHELLVHINNLFNQYVWDKEMLYQELNPFPEISQLFSKIALNEKLQSKLESKNLSSIKGKI